MHPYLIFFIPTEINDIFVMFPTNMQQPEIYHIGNLKNRKIRHFLRLSRYGTLS